MDKMFFRIMDSFWIGAFEAPTSFKTNKTALFLAIMMLNGKKFIRYHYDNSDIELAERTFEFVKKHQYIANLGTSFIENADALMRYLIEASGGDRKRKQEYINSVDSFYLWVS